MDRRQGSTGKRKGGPMKEPPRAGSLTIRPLRLVRHVQVGFEPTFPGRE